MRSKTSSLIPLLLTCVKMSQNFVYGEFAVELDVGDLVLLSDPLQVITEGLRIISAAERSLGAACIAGLLGGGGLVAPVRLVSLHPVGKLPAAPADNRQGKHVVLVLLGRVSQKIQPAPRPVIPEGIVVRHLHEVLHLDEVEVPVRAIRSRHFRGDECVVHRGEPLLTVEDDVLGAAIGAVEAVDRLAGESAEVLRLALPEQEAADVVVEEDRPHEVADVPWLPLELALEVGDDEPAILEPSDQSTEADVVRLLRVFHLLLSRPD